MATVWNSIAVWRRNPDGTLTMVTLPLDLRALLRKAA
jgi:hypothetical protein